MTAFCVWAPLKRQVELVVDGARHAMTQDPDGWWRADVATPPEVDYAFSVEGGAPLPDPRAPDLPRGVHAPGRRVDFDAMKRRDAGFRAPPLASGVVYELHVGTFSDSGTFDGVATHLDHLVALGVTHVELMPVASFPGARGWGYDGVGLYAPHAAYGGPRGLARLVDACHARGLAVLLDVVYNHLGPDGNYLAEFAPYFTDRYHTPWGKVVNLDDRYALETRRFFIDNARHWFERYRVDGLRLDAVETLFDMSAIHFLEELATEIDELEARLGRPLVLIAESGLNDPRVVRPREAGGYGIDAQWSDDFHHAIHALLTGERTGYYEDFGSFEDLARALRHAFVYDGRYSTFRKRRHGAPTGELSGHRFLGYSQTHDQVGNRALGERLSHLAGDARARIAAALVFTSPFLPMLFAGEEWAASTPFQYFTSFDDAALGRAVRNGRRREFAEHGWPAQSVPDPQSPDTFARSKLRWSELDAPTHRAMLDFYRRLIALRKREPDLLSGQRDAIDVTFDAEEGWMSVRRGTTLTAFNLGSRRARVAARELLLASGDVTCTNGALDLGHDALAIARR
jgi:maltooligosyltrehalose trehalohydrolase